MDLQFKKLRPNIITPTRGTPESSGLDIYSDQLLFIPPHSDYSFPTGLVFDIPEGYDLCVYNKSGTSTKLKVLKGAELIDSDYIGEIHIHLFNLSNKYVRFKPGDKLAQIVMRPVVYPDLVEVNEITRKTIRGTGGFGSTDRI